MSAIAINVKPDLSEIVLLSDGNRWHYKTGELLNNDQSKIHHINEHVSVLGIGRTGAGVQVLEPLRELPMQNLSPQEVSDYLGGWLRITYEEYIDEDEEFLFYVIGFNKEGNIELYEIMNATEEAEKYGFKSDAEPFQPVKKPVEPGMILAVAVGIPPEKSTYQDHFKARISKGESLKEACINSFRDFVEELQAKDIQVGGKLFHSVISQPWWKKVKQNLEK